MFCNLIDCNMHSHDCWYMSQNVQNKHNKEKTHNRLVLLVITPHVDLPWPSPVTKFSLKHEKQKQHGRRSQTNNAVMSQRKHGRSLTGTFRKQVWFNQAKLSSPAYLFWSTGIANRNDQWMLWATKAQHKATNMYNLPRRETEIHRLQKKKSHPNRVLFMIETYRNSHLPP